MEDFFQHVLNGLNLGAIYALIALGYTMVYGVLQFINFAHAEVYMLGAFSIYYANKWLHLSDHPGWMAFGISIAIAIVVCSAVGLLIERLAYRPLRGSPRLNILITAIGVSLFLQFSGQAVFGADPKLFPQVLMDSEIVRFGQIQIRSFDLTILGVSMAAMALLHFLIHHTKMGRAIQAVRHSQTSASLMGINVNFMISLVFVLGSSLAGVGAVLVGLKYPKIDPLMGMLIGLKAFVAAVVGGIGSLPGAVVGGLLMGLSEEMVVAYLSSTYRDALAFGLLILILVLRPSGLFGKSQVEKV
ncbi:branched-chain amino acid ABC transporter permease [bacterium]|nr:branched-chain amino acid ABC transporter permease [bacterium]